MTQIQSVRELLASSAVFSGLPEAMLTEIAGCGTLGGVPQGTAIFRAGEQADTFYVIRRGQVAIEIAVPGRGAIVIATRGPGDAVGWSWLFPPFRWHFDAMATAPIRLIRLDGACLRAKCDGDPALGYQLMRRFAQLAVDDLQGTRMQVMDVYGNVAAR